MQSHRVFCNLLKKRKSTCRAIENNLFLFLNIRSVVICVFKIYLQMFSKCALLGTLGIKLQYNSNLFFKSPDWLCCRKALRDILKLT